MGGPARAAAPGPVEAGAIRQVIASQIDAFRHGDAHAAFSYAAPDIRSRFGDEATFMAMARAGYQPVTDPQSYAFGTIEEGQGGEPVQHVELTAADGTVTTALYTMQHEPDGTWRVAACALLRPERLGA